MRDKRPLGLCCFRLFWAFLAPALSTQRGDTGGAGGADGVADGAADGGMPKAYKGRPAGRRDRTWPRAEPMMSRRTLGGAVADSYLPGTPEGSLALPRLRR